MVKVDKLKEEREGMLSIPNQGFLPSQALYLYYTKVHSKKGKLDFGGCKYIHQGPLHCGQAEDLDSHPPALALTQ